MKAIFKEQYRKFLEIGRPMFSFASGDLLNTILIVLRVKKELKKLNKDTVDKYQLYQIMTDISYDIQPFRGNVDDFYKIFYVSKDSFTDIGDLLSIIQEHHMVYAIPTALENGFINSIKKSEAKSVLILNIEGFSISLFKTVKEHPEIKFSFMMNNIYDSACYLLLKEIYNGLDNAYFIKDDIYSLSYYETVKYHETAKYDLILAVPRFNTVSSRELKNFNISNSWDGIATEILLNLLKANGELKIVLTPKIILSGGRNSHFRKYLLDNYKLLEIADLPAGLFNKMTMIRTVLFTLSTGTSDKIKVKKYVSDKPLLKDVECNLLILNAEKSISIKELQVNDSWNISLLLENDNEIAQYKNTGLPMVKLKDIADVFRGKATSKLSSGKKVGVINIADITDNEIDYDKVNFVDDEQQKIIKYLLEDGDILISSRGTTIKVAMFEKQDKQYIPAVNFNIIRIHESAKSKIKSEYLKIFFASSIGQKLLSSFQRGEIVVNITAKDLYNLNIPLLSLQEQQKIIDQYNEEFAKYKRTLQQITDKWNNVKENIDHIFITKRE